MSSDHKRSSFRSTVTFHGTVTAWAAAILWFMAVLTSGVRWRVGVKKKKTKKIPVSQTKRLGREAGDSVRDASTASKSSPHRSIYISHCLINK
jgi:hypothetical protein